MFKANIPDGVAIHMTESPEDAPFLMKFLECPMSEASASSNAPPYVSAVRSTSTNDVLDYDHD